MQNYYLIDFENVREAGLTGANMLDADSHIYLFYTDNANRLALDAIAGIDAEFRAVKVIAGRQSLDMHLISFLGYIIGKSQDKCSCTIISNDKGFDGTVAFWNASGLAVCERRAKISTASEKAPEEKAVSDKQPQKAKPERRDRQRRNERRTSARNENQASAQQAESSPAEETVPAQPVINEAPAAEIIITEAVPEEAAAEVQTAQDIPGGETASSDISAPSEETAGADETQPAPRKKTHRGGRGRGKKSAEQKASHSESAEDSFESSPEQAPEDVSPEKAPVSEEKSAAESKPAISANPRIAENLRAASVDEAIIESIGKIVVSCAEKKNVKQAVYREIIRRYGQKQGLEYYGIIKKNV